MRFSKEYINELNYKLQKSQKNLDELSYNELNQVLKENLPKNKLDLQEYYYLLAKIANILADFTFFSNKQLVGNVNLINNIGFKIWFANYLFRSNKLDSAENQIDTLYLKTAYQDSLLLTDLLYVKIHIKSEKKEFREILEIFEKNKTSIDDLEEFSFSKIGISYKLAITNYVLGNRKLAKQIIEKGLKITKFYKENYYYPRFIGLKGWLLIRSEGKLEKGHFYYQDALNRAKLEGIQSEIAYHYKTLSLYEIESGHYEIAYEYNKKAEKINDSLGNKQELKNILYNNGLLLVKLGKFEKAEKNYNKALQLYKETNDSQRIIQVYNGIGILAQDQGNLDKAIQYYQKALEISIKENYIRNRINLLNNISTIYKQKAAYNDAIDIIKEAIEIYNKNIEKLDINGQILYLNLVELNIHQGNFLQSLQISNKSIDLEKLNADELGYLFLLESKANYHLGEILNSQKAANKSLENYELTKSPFNVALGLQNVAKINYVLNKKKKSIVQLKKALKILKENKIFGDLYHEVKLEIIEVLVTNFEFDEAERNINALKTIIYQKEVVFPEYREDQLKFLALLQKNLENIISESELLEFYNELEEKDYYTLRMKTLMLLIDFYLNKFNLDKALILIDEGIKLATKKDNLILEIEISFLKSLVLSKQGKIEEAKSLCTSFTTVLEEKKLISYKSRMLETLKLINDQEKFNFVYSTVGESQKEKESSINENKLETEVFDYLKHIMRYVKEKEMCLT